MAIGITPCRVRPASFWKRSMSAVRSLESRAPACRRRQAGGGGVERAGGLSRSAALHGPGSGSALKAPGCRSTAYRGEWCSVRPVRDTGRSTAGSASRARPPVRPGRPALQIQELDDERRRFLVGAPLAQRQQQASVRRQARAGSAGRRARAPQRSTAAAASTARKLRWLLRTA